MGSKLEETNLNHTLLPLKSEITVTRVRYNLYNEGHLWSMTDKTTLTFTIQYILQSTQYSRVN